MRDLILQCAGAAGILVALIHGVLGETKVFAKATIQPESLRTLIRLVWAGRHRCVDRRRGAADCRTLARFGERAALDRPYRDRDLRLRLCSKRMVVARSRLWLESPWRCRRARGRRVLGRPLTLNGKRSVSKDKARDEYETPANIGIILESVFRHR